MRAEGTGILGSDSPGRGCVTSQQFMKASLRCPGSSTLDAAPREEATDKEFGTLKGLAPVSVS